MSGEAETDYTVTIPFRATYSFVRDWVDRNAPIGVSVVIRSEETVERGVGL